MQPDDPVAETTAPSKLIGGRYQPLETLGEGTSGVVHRCWDTVTRAPVAVKVITVTSGRRARRIKRELAALRALKLPGVVELLDEGLEGERPYLVMALVDGHPFPGPLPPGQGLHTWSSLAGPTLALLGVLHRVHEAGVIHRDLKPANILVDKQGRPVILDFGLARGPALGATITATGTILGTPRFLAPEQILGRPADHRADLYAVGVMLFEQLSGRLPHPADDPHTLMHKRLAEAAPPLSRVAPRVPPSVAAMVDRLMARDPESRPRSAAEALSGLRSAGDGADRAMPWLGPTTPIDALVKAGLARRPLDVVGARGTGRSRCLEEAAQRLGQAGRLVLTTRPGQRPFESMPQDLQITMPQGGNSGSITEAVRVAIVEQLDAGAVLIADDLERLDRWTRALLERLRAEGRGLLRARLDDGPDISYGGEIVRPVLLGESDLGPLFAGPDALLHRQTDGARALFATTAGHVGAVAAEVSAWVGTGMARWVPEGPDPEQDRAALEVDRRWLDELAERPPLALAAVRSSGSTLEDPEGPLETLLAWITLAWPHATVERLEALTGQARWALVMELSELAAAGAAQLEEDTNTWAPRAPSAALSAWDHARRRSAHRAVADQLPPGSPRRLSHVLAAGDAVEAAAEARRLARRLKGEGRAEAAARALESALDAARQSGAEAVEGPLLEALLAVALEEAELCGSGSLLRRARYALERSHLEAAQIAPLEAVVAAGLALTPPEEEMGAASPGSQSSPVESADVEATLEAVNLEPAETAPPPPDPVALTMLRQLPVSALADPDLQRCRDALQARAALLEGHPPALSTPGGGDPLDEINARLTGAWAVADDPERAAPLFSAAARITRPGRRPDPARVLSLHLDALEAHRAALEVEVVRAEAGALMTDARTRRLPWHEARALWLCRWAHLNSPDAEQPCADMEVARSALTMAGAEPTTADAAAHLLLGEAVRAWRTGDATALDYAGQARWLWRRARRPLLTRLSRALWLAAAWDFSRPAQRAGLGPAAERLASEILALSGQPDPRQGAAFHLTPVALVEAQILGLVAQVATTEETGGLWRSAALARWAEPAVDRQEMTLDVIAWGGLKP